MVDRPYSFTRVRTPVDVPRNSRPSRILKRATPYVIRRRSEIPRPTSSHVLWINRYFERVDRYRAMYWIED